MKTYLRRIPRLSRLEKTVTGIASNVTSSIGHLPQFFTVLATIDISAWDGGASRALC
nr:hypothetical protein [Candidatus Sigynarchaeota archaeon]